MNNREKMIYNHFIPAFYKKNKQEVGIELEFPIQSLNGELPEKNKLMKILPFMKKYGFLPAKYSYDGNIIWSRNKDGVYLSFDSSYLNFEFSLPRVHSIEEANLKFQQIKGNLEKVLKQQQLQLCGLALNQQAIENKESFRVRREPSEICEIEYEYLKEYGSNQVFTHKYHPNFFTIISSVQTHFDSDEQHLVQLMNVLSNLDFLEILLFANSPYKIGNKMYLDSRYYLYRNSAFAPLGLTGSNEEYSSVDDIVKDYASRKVPWVSSDKDGKLFYSYRNAELSNFGTVEYRVVDTQPLSEAFVPAAFNYGLIRKIDETQEILQKIKKDYFAHYSQNELTDFAATLEAEEIFVRKEVCDLVWKLYEIAESGLYENEKYLLKPLEKRIDGFLSPAKERIK